MMKLENEDYVARISSATALQMVIITYELAIGHIEKAISFQDTDESAFIDNVTKSREFLGSLIDALDLSYDVGRQLMLTYISINKLLVDAGIKKDGKPLDLAAQMLGSLLEGWREIEKNDPTRQVMQNTQQVFAGLTYGREGLNEYIHEDSRRGYKA